MCKEDVLQIGKCSSFKKVSMNTNWMRKLSLRYSSDNVHDNFSKQYDHGDGSSSRV